MVAAAATVAWLLLRYRPFRAEVSGDSMAPTLSGGEWVLALRGLPVGRGDVVVVEHPRRPGFEMVKRVTGAPGDEGLSPGEWFVEGDNPAWSTDSSSFGPVPRGAIRGRVVFVYWPPGRWRAVRRDRA
jgi:nickel-type superoxide dismutase maturation protease